MNSWSGCTQIQIQIQIQIHLAEYVNSWPGCTHSGWPQDTMPHSTQLLVAGFKQFSEPLGHKSTFWIWHHLTPWISITRAFSLPMNTNICVQDRPICSCIGYSCICVRILSPVLKVFISSVIVSYIWCKKRFLSGIQVSPERGEGGLARFGWPFSHQLAIPYI